MADLVGGISLFLVFVLSHAVLYRIHWIQLEPPRLLFLSLFVFLVSLCLRPLFLGGIAAPPLSNSEIFRVSFFYSSALLYFLLCLWYVMECTLLEAESPSMVIIGFIRKQRGGRATRDQLEKLFSDETLLLARLKDLVAHGYVTSEEGRYRLSLRGRWIAGFFRIYRQFIHRGLGG